ncbi:hypothetical protein IPM09_05385 [Candidatus Saccharibacteria bacterium]|nr:MAG: hypothetical protein IPM09_05385 [Candidatus Saccharibacteria bacterium]
MATRASGATHKKASERKQATGHVTQPAEVSSRGIEYFKYLSDGGGREAQTKQPEPGLDKKVEEIFDQAKAHRSSLLWFYIWYTVVFSLVVIGLIFMQAYARVTIPGFETIELVPQWAMYLLVVGMFGQFISLLMIITRKVWTFEPFFKHHNDSLRTDFHDEQG